MTVISLDSLRHEISGDFPVKFSVLKPGAGPGAGSRPHSMAWQDARHVRRLSQQWRTRLEPTAYEIASVFALSSLRVSGGPGRRSAPVTYLADPKAGAELLRAATIAAGAATEARMPHRTARIG